MKYQYHEFQSTIRFHSHPAHQQAWDENVSAPSHSYNTLLEREQHAQQTVKQVLGSKLDAISIIPLIVQ